ARLAGNCSQESASIKVTAGDSVKAELTLGSGAILWIKLQDKEEGAEISASLRVVDEDGRELTGMFSMADLQHIYMDGTFSPTEHRLGPLAPGKYRVEAWTSDGKRAAKSVTVRAGAVERKLTLRLKK
ncbi:MAG: hypothetical protein ACI841_002351, partial [Planctomycetota bacterium]